jgi:hypothetical protein
VWSGSTSRTGERNPCPLSEGERLRCCGQSTGTTELDSRKPADSPGFDEWFRMRTETYSLIGDYEKVDCITAAVSHVQHLLGCGSAGCTQGFEVRGNQGELIYNENKRRPTPGEEVSCALND